MQDYKGAVLEQLSSGSPKSRITAARSYAHSAGLSVLKFQRCMAGCSYYPCRCTISYALLASEARTLLDRIGVHRWAKSFLRRIRGSSNTGMSRFMIWRARISSRILRIALHSSTQDAKLVSFQPSLHCLKPSDIIPPSSPPPGRFTHHPFPHFEPL